MIGLVYVVDICTNPSSQRIVGGNNLKTRWFFFCRREKINRLNQSVEARVCLFFLLKLND